MAVRYDFYEDYCQILCGGYIDRFESITEYSHKKYTDNLKKYILGELYEYCAFCPTLWPKLNEVDDFEIEMSTFHCMSLANLNKEKKFIHEELIHANEDDYDEDSFKEVIMDKFATEYIEPLKEEFNTKYQTEPQRMIHAELADEKDCPFEEFLRSDGVSIKNIVSNL